MSTNLKRTCVLLLKLICWASITGLLSGCSNDIDVGKTINSALLAGQNVSNYEARIRIEIVMDNRGQRLEIPSTVNMIVFDDPYRVKMLATSNATTSQESESYIIRQDDTIIAYTKPQDVWERHETHLESYTDTDLHNQANLIELYLENTRNFTYIGTEQINSKKAHKLRGVLTGKSLTHAVNSISILPKNLFPDPAIIDELVDKIDPLPIELWIDKETLHPIQYKMDVADTITSILEETETPLAGSISFSKAIVIMTLKNINQATPFDLPPDVIEGL
ncbi:MAG: hypothetical protein FWG40_05240 [Peptococcaceae bacterium]|nr:hypothetical protein [Peptococcaceae bacterium]